MIFAQTPVPAALALLALPAALPVFVAPIVKAVASRTSGVEHDLQQLRPWNLPAWK